jgi:CRP-like cAMP-binding protein
VLFVHHEGKNGGATRVEPREDLLDVVISLARPSDYGEQEGARFILKFKKARGLCGTDVDDIEAALSTDATGAQQWTWKRSDAANDSRILELLQLGMSNSDVATEIGCNRSTVFRARKRFIAAGLLEDQNRKP